MVAALCSGKPLRPRYVLPTTFEVGRQTSLVTEASKDVLRWNGLLIGCDIFRDVVRSGSKTRSLSMYVLQVWSIKYHVVHFSWSWFSITFHQQRAVAIGKTGRE